MKTCVLQDVVFPIRLLDHEQIETIEATKMVKIFGTVRRVGIAAEKNIRPARPDLCQNVNVPSWLYLYLDALITGGEFSLDFVEQLRVRILNAN